MSLGTEQVYAMTRKVETWSQPDRALKGRVCVVLKEKKVEVGSVPLRTQFLFQAGSSQTGSQGRFGEAKHFTSQ